MSKESTPCLEMTPTTIKENEKKRKSVTQESHHPNKKGTSKDKSKILKNITQTTKSSPTSEVESTTEEKDSRPFWNEFTREISERLLLPTKTDCVDMGFELVEFIFKKASCKIVVFRRGEESSSNSDPNTERFADDLLTIVNYYFVAKQNGLRAGENRRRRRNEEDRKGDGTEEESIQDETERKKKRKIRKEGCRKSHENQTVSDSESE